MRWRARSSISSLRSEAQKDDALWPLLKDVKKGVFKSSMVESTYRYLWLIVVYSQDVGPEPVEIFFDFPSTSADAYIRVFVLHLPSCIEDLVSGSNGYGGCEAELPKVLGAKVWDYSNNKNSTPTLIRSRFSSIPAHLPQRTRNFSSHLVVSPKRF